jgi:O-antigen ligase
LQERPIQIYVLLFIFILISSHIAEQRFGNPFPELDATSVKLDRLVPRFVFLLFFVNFIRTYRDVKLVLWTIVVLILLTAVSAVPGPGNYRVVAAMGISSAGNPNWFAFFCEFGIALIWSYRHAIRRRWQWVLFSAIVGGLAIIVLMTASRSGLLNLLLLFALLTMQGRFSIKRQLQTVLVIFLVGYLGLPLLSSSHLERLGNTLPGGSSETKGSGSGEDRIRTVKTGLKMIAREPLFGVGIGNFVWYHLQMSEAGESTAPHNSYLWAAAEGGIPVLLLYLMLFGYTFTSFRKVEQEANHPELRAIASGLRIGLLVFLSFSFFAEFWLNIMTYILVGLALVLRRLQERESLTTVAGVVPRAESQAPGQKARLYQYEADAP